MLRRKFFKLSNLLVMLIALASIIAAANVFKKPSRAAAVEPPSGGVKRLLRVWVYSEDIYPDVIRAKTGTYFISAENQTQSNISLVIGQKTARRRFRKSPD